MFSEICPEICRKYFQAGRSVFPQISPDFSDHIFQSSNQMSPQDFKTHFCRHGNPKTFWRRYPLVSWSGPPLFKGPKKTTKPENCTNSTKEFSEEFEGFTQQNKDLRQIAPESSPEVRQSLCHTISLWYRFLL